MATRPVFVSDLGGKLVGEVLVKFEWHPGFAVVQKQRSVASLHKAAAELLRPGTRLLEVSTKSTEYIGVRLSAFNLKIRHPQLERSVTLEAAYQGSKIFEKSGQHEDLYALEDGREVKRRVAEYAEERVVAFRFGNEECPTQPVTAFYDYLYLTALSEAVTDQPELRAELLEFGAFTDIEFNPARSINCQARSAALFVALVGADALAEADSMQSLIRLLESARSGLGDLVVPLRPAPRVRH